MVRAAAPGVGLGGIILIAGVLYYTGAGSMMLEKMQDFSAHCYMAVPQAARAVGEPVCNAIEYGVEGVTAASNAVKEIVAGVEQQFEALFASSFDGLGSLGASFQQAVSGLASPMDRLNQLALSGPNGLGIARDAGQQLQQAIDSFTIGQQYQAQGSTAAALPWLMRGAEQPNGYGLLSQLSLGDMYRSGGNGMAPDPLRAQAYYQQAANSLVMLNQSNTPQSQQLLQTLPVAPAQLQQQLLQVISQIKSQSGR